MSAKGKYAEMHVAPILAVLNQPQVATQRDAVREAIEQIIDLHLVKYAHEGVVAVLRSGIAENAIKAMIT